MTVDIKTLTEEQILYMLKPGAYVTCQRGPRGLPRWCHWDDRGECAGDYAGKITVIRNNYLCTTLAGGWDWALPGDSTYSPEQWHRPGYLTPEIPDMRKSQFIDAKCDWCGTDSFEQWCEHKEGCNAKNWRVARKMNRKMNATSAPKLEGLEISDPTIIDDAKELDLVHPEWARRPLSTTVATGAEWFSRIESVRTQLCREEDHKRRGLTCTSIVGVRAAMECYVDHDCLPRDYEAKKKEDYDYKQRYMNEYVDIIGKDI